jgi:hypothetical protein
VGEKGRWWMDGWMDEECLLLFVGLAYRGKDIVFTFIIEYSSLREFGPYVIIIIIIIIIIGLFSYEDFQKMIFWVVLKLEISYRVIIIS